MANQTIDVKNFSGGEGLGFLMRALAGGVVAAIVAILLSHTSGWSAALGIGSLIFLASFAVGSFLGFLFGVPRVLSKENANGSGIPNDESSSSESGRSNLITNKTTASARFLQSNTNLERISDWLTTLLVGAGLVEVHRLNDGLILFRNFLRENAKVFPADSVTQLSTAGSIPAVGPLILIFGVAAGFLFMYLNTRLVLIRLFQSIERHLAGEDVLPPEGQRAIMAFSAQSSGETSFVGSQFKSSANATVEDAINLMFDGLYKSEPERVIELGSSLLHTEAAKRADYWFYLAAAFGQQMHKAKNDSSEWISARENALDCARRAINIDQTYRNRLWFISDPEGFDNDLAQLRDDAEFRRLVGRRIS